MIRTALNVFFIVSIITEYAECIETNVCGDWISYKDEKCVKIFNKEETHDFETAKQNCHQLDNSSTLISLNSLEEENFVSEFLFTENKIVDSVWIGLKRDNKSVGFKWVDNSEFRYSDWLENSPSKGDNEDCVEMKSKYDFYSSTNFGKWSSVPCSKNNVVLCQKNPDFSVSYLQNVLLELKKSVEENIQPIESVYIQLPNQLSPQEMWPRMKWTDISPEYKNVFFRVIGDKSEPFGKIQNESQSQISEVMSRFQIDVIDGKLMSQKLVDKESWDISLANNGWSKWLWTGAAAVSGGIDRAIRIRHTEAEVRPINMAIKVWKRVG